MPDIFQDSSRYFHISAFYALSLPYYHMEHHTHSSYEIMYITSGSCRVFCLDGTQDTEFPLKSGQFIFIRPDVPHRLEIPDGFPCSILNLEFSLTPEKSPVALELLLKKDPGFSMSGSFFLYIERKAVEIRPIIQRMLIMIYCAKCVYDFYKYDIILCIRN